jgi:hypothetical protein
MGLPPEGQTICCFVDPPPETPTARPPLSSSGSTCAHLPPSAAQDATAADAATVQRRADAAQRAHDEGVARKAAADARRQRQLAHDAEVRET